MICVEVTAQGTVELMGNTMTLSVEGTDRQFVLADDVAAKPDFGKQAAIGRLRAALARGERVVAVTGYVDGWSGRWPTVLNKAPAKRPRLMVTSYQVAKGT